MALFDLLLSSCFLASKGEIDQTNCLFKFHLINFIFFLSQAAFQTEFKWAWQQPDKTSCQVSILEKDNTVKYIKL